jgi:Uma2 family endonuclease
VIQGAFIMSTAMATPRTQPAVPSPERFTVRDATWELYDRLTDALAEGAGIRAAFDGKDIEIMVLGPIHERVKELIGLFVNLVLLELGIDFEGLGSTTWKRPELRRGLEADLCFLFDADKLAAHVQAVARKSNDIADYPNPDLAIEIDISPSKIDRPGIHAALKVPEIWRFEDGTILIEQLGGDGTYAEVEVSRFLHVRADEVVRWMIEEDCRDKGAWARRLREWVRVELKPRASRVAPE